MSNDAQATCSLPSATMDNRSGAACVSRLRARSTVCPVGKQHGHTQTLARLHIFLRDDTDTVVVEQHPHVCKHTKVTTA